VSNAGSADDATAGRSAPSSPSHGTPEVNGSTSSANSGNSLPFNNSTPDRKAGGAESRQKKGRSGGSVGLNSADAVSASVLGTAAATGAKHPGALSSTRMEAASVPAQTSAPAPATVSTSPNKGLSYSVVQRPQSLRIRGMIRDSALRAVTSKSPAPVVVKKKGVYRIDRNWQFGLLVAPDFTSVNSLAGDKAGSSLGLTVDYQFAPHWYLSTGILATRKNYAARNQDYHASTSFYQNNRINGNVSFVKGSFYMMEIPLNLRYDFIAAGSTLFFVSAGASSYLMTTENANVYWRHYNMDQCNAVDHIRVDPTSLFSCINLSAGVETGLTNSLSLVIAPYMKIPTKNLGAGQVQMNSVGINFALKWSPITRMKRD
jgi:hypothetical protein